MDGTTWIDLSSNCIVLFFILHSYVITTFHFNEKLCIPFSEVVYSP